MHRNRDNPSLATLAGISHNAIYRHYRSVEDMALDLAADFAQQLRSGLSQARDEVKSGAGPARTVVGWLFDFALAHPAHFKTAHLTRMGPPGAARELLEAQLAEIRQDMRTQLTHKKMLPEMPADDLDAALALIIENTFQLCIRCIESPQQRPALLLRAEQVFTWVLAGAALTAQRGGLPKPGP